MANDAALASDFAPPTRQEWLAAVGKALKGADFDKTLVSTTLDGIRIEPLYLPGELPERPGLEDPPALRPDGGWDIRTSITHPDPAVANSQALADLANGATSVEFSVWDAAAIPTLLAGIVLAAAPVALRPQGDATAVATAFLELADSEASGCLGMDPLGSGKSLESAVGVAQTVVERKLATRTFRASASPAADAGATEAQEIGYLLWVATSYLRALTDAGLSGDQAARQIELEITADVDIFATIAKLRAVRHTWAAVLLESGIDPADAISVSAVSSYRTLTVVDPWVNLLRGTAACLGAVLGGADVVTIAPFDSADALPGELGRRMARNTQLILRSESGVGRVLDPTGGSWYVESLTDELAQRGWALFQQLENAGVPDAAFAMLANEIRTAAQARDLAVARRKRPITGVSEFPLLGEAKPPATPAPQAPPGPLPRRRLAQPFEDLRTIGEARGFKVFLANLGPVSAHTARATFAENLFASGGVAVVSARVDADSVAAAFAASGASVACLCSSDPVYEAQGAGVVEALRGAGARRIYLAGKLAVPGVDEQIAIGGNVLDVLAQLHQTLENA